VRYPTTQIRIKNNHFPLIQTKTEVKSESAITKKKYMFFISISNTPAQRAGNAAEFSIAAVRVPAKIISLPMRPSEKNWLLARIREGNNSYRNLAEKKNARSQLKEIT